MQSTGGISLGETTFSVEVTTIVDSSSQTATLTGKFVVDCWVIATIGHVTQLTAMSDIAGAMGETVRRQGGRAVDRSSTWITGSSARSLWSHQEGSLLVHLARIILLSFAVFF